MSLGIPDKRLVGFGGSLGSDVAVALAVKIAAPLLIVHGTADRSIPYDFGRRLFALAREPKTFVTDPQGGHLPIDAVIPRVLQWITRLIASA